VEELVAAVGSSDLVRAVSIRHGFVAVERGDRPVSEPFTLDTAISWGTTPPPRSLRRLARALAAEVSARLRAGRIRS